MRIRILSLEDDVPSTKYKLDTTKINELNIIYQTDLELKASLRLTMLKYFGPGLDTIEVVVPEFTAKVWWPD